MSKATWSINNLKHAAVRHMWSQILEVTSIESRDLVSFGTPILVGFYLLRPPGARAVFIHSNVTI